MVSLIPRSVLFGNPERLSPQISPDGKYLAFIAPDSKNVLQVWVRSLDGTDDRVLTTDKKRGIRSFFWTYQPDRLIYLQDADGDENFHLFLVDVLSLDVKDITPFPGVRAQVVALEPTHPEELLVGLNKEDARKHDVYRVSLKDGSVTLDTSNPGNVIGWTPDANLQIRAALTGTPDGGHEVWVRDNSKDAWRTLLVLGPDEQGGPVEFSKDGKTLYLLSTVNANAQRLLAWDLGHDKFTVVAEDLQYDVSGLLTHPTRRTIEAVAFYRDKLQWQVLDDHVREDFAVLSKVSDGELHIGHGDLHDHFWLVSAVVDVGSVRYYLYDRREKKATLLFTQRPALDGLPLVPIKPVSYKSRDGLQLHGYLTLPAETEGLNLPVVLLVHGGPWARDHWGFNPMAQWLANRGYAVLQVNYRGSTGYGKDFLNAGNREWAGKMHDDLIDGVNWLVNQRIADPKRIAIMGGSYGGYATLVGVTFTPDVFCCGVDIVGPSNIITLIQTIPPYWEPMKATFARRLGVVDRDEEFMKSRSPLFFVDRIKVPLLIAQGANDPRVKQAESDQIVEAMRKNGKPVEYLVYTDEGHGFARPQNRLHFYARAEAFLEKYLGGRAEPATEIKGHSAQER
jgi:dipeptidyl aminopeptidase/acylaminoacyl peptidase